MIPSTELCQVLFARFNDEFNVIVLFKVVVPDTFKLLYIIVLLDVFTTRPAAPPPDCNNKLFIHLRTVSPVEADDEKLPGVDETP